MRIRALIDCRLGGTTGHMVPIARGETADVAEAVAVEGLQQGIVEPVDQAGSVRPEPVADDVPENEPDPVVDQLVEILIGIVASEPEEASLRADGMPRTGTVRRAGADFDFEEDQLEEAWDRVQQQGD